VDNVSIIYVLSCKKVIKVTAENVASQYPCFCNSKSYLRRMETCKKIGCLLKCHFNNDIGNSDAQNNGFHYFNLVFSESVNNSYQWKSPLSFLTSQTIENEDYL